MTFGANEEVHDDERSGDVPAPFSGYRRALATPANVQLAPSPFGYSDSDEGDVPAGILNYWNMLAKWRWLIAACFVIGIATGVATSMMTTPVYRASSTIQIDTEPAKVKPVESQQNLYDDPEKFYQTQYELLKSRALAERVADREGLVDDPKFMNQWASNNKSASIAGQGDRKARIARAATLINSGLRIEPVRNSRIVKIIYESPNPAVAARVANAIGDNFITWNLERRYEASATARRFLEDRLQQTRQALEDSQRRGNEYAQKNQLITLGGGSSGDAKDGRPATGESLVAADLTAINEALAVATATRIQSEQRWRQAVGTPDMMLPDVISNGSVQALKAQRDAAAAEYQQNLRLYKPDYPTMTEAKAKIDTLDQQLTTQARSIRNSLKTQYELALNNERQLQGEVDKRKAELLVSQGKRVEQGFIETDVSTTRTLYDSMLATYKEIGIAGAVGENNISFVDKAQAPRVPFKPETRKNLLIFAAFGLALGSMLAVLLEAFDLSMKVPEDVEKHLGLPVLGTIPIMSGDVSPGRALEDPKSKLSEGYYSVRAALQFATEDGVPSSLVVTSSTPSEGKSTSALAIASGFARLGFRVLLVDADMRDPSLHKVLGRDNGVGLSNLLAGGADASPALQPTNHANLTFLSSGPPPPNPAELLGSGKMRAFVDAAKVQFDLVVIDAPPVMGLADAPQLASVVSGVIMIVEAARTKRDLAKGAVRRLRASNGRLVGAILTKFDLSKAGYAYGHAYGSGYGYGYGFDYGSQPKKIARQLGVPKPWLRPRRRA